MIIINTNKNDILINSISITCKCSVHNVTVIIVDVQGIASINNSLQYLIKNISIEIASNHECIINDLTGKIDQLFTITITEITINFYETSPFLWCSTDTKKVTFIIHAHSKKYLQL